MMTVSVEDNGPGLDAARPHREGVGLSNTRERLQGLYGPAATLTLGPANGAAAPGARVEIRLPARRA
jgi:LytS/YehU family sensor histidine kinase